MMVGQHVSTFTMVDHSITAHQQSQILGVSEVEDGLAQLRGAHP